MSPTPSSTGSGDPISAFPSTRASTQATTPADSEDLDDEEEDTQASTKNSKGATTNDEERTGSRKKRTLPNRAYVEISTRPSLRNRKSTAKSTLVEDEDPEEPISARPARARRASSKAATPAPSAKALGKRKAVEITNDSDGELASDDSLEYNSDADVQESSGSGSEFEASAVSEEDEEEGEDEDVPLAKTHRRRKAPTPDLDEDEAMMDVAVQMSLAASAGIGAEEEVTPENLRELRARAAELRVAQRKQAGGSGTADDAIDVDELTDELSTLTTDDDEASRSKRKGKAKGKGKAKVKGKTAIDADGNIVSLAELKKMRRAEKQSKTAKKRMLKEEERRLAKELGRRLIQSEKNTIALLEEHPELRDVWGDLETTIKPAKPQKAEQPANLKVKLLPFQEESLFWMRNQERSVWKGGMLADEMGMGKTIQIIALIVSTLTPATKPNLVVAPTVAVMQWRNEFAAHTEGLKVLVWHGAGRETDTKEITKYDVVLTTYAVLESAFRKQHSGFKRKGQIIKEKSLPHQIKWHRVVLDEAHNIKERHTNTAKATFELLSEYKWCLSGTPLQNRVGELYSLIRFIGADPFAYYYCKKCDCKSLHWKFTNKRNCDNCGCTPMQHTCFWNNEILAPIQKCGMEGAGATAFKKLRVLLDRIMLRRTKLERADDLGLPPRTVIVRRDYFSPEEKELYHSLYTDAKRQFSSYVEQGTILNNYSNLFSLITRMRQMACHPDLVLRSKNNEGKFLINIDGEATLCRLCNDVAEDALKARCNHIFDRECIRQYLNAAGRDNPDCPVCHVPLTIDLDAPPLELGEESTTKRQGILGRLSLDKWRSSTKIEALIEELTTLRNQDATTKSIVFSQFVNFLDLIAYRLQRAGFVIARLEGNMSPQARDLTIKHFMNNVHVTVFLVSLKAGGVALNLTEANRVYLMDSWWNPAVEFQAMDRIHRLGQHRPVQAIKLVVEDSIESRIVQLQEKKSAMIDATLSTDDSAMGRLTPEDLGFLFRL